jgi:tetratricopeptide (TPR) repeat protein
VVLLVLAGVAGGGYWYFVLRQPVATTAADLEGRLVFVETALANDRLAQASEAVENILADAPDNARALELKKQINEALAQQKEPEPTPATTTVPRVTQPKGPSTAQRVDSIVADASMALAGGNIQQAQNLIAQGEKLAPDDQRWGRLKTQITEKEYQLRQQGEAQRRAQAVNSLLKTAAEYIVAEDFDRAIEAYDQVLEIDPANATAATGKANATNLARQRTAAIASIRRISPTKTEYIPPPGQRDGPKGFEGGGGVKVKRATRAASFPGELVIELNPPNAQPGQPYEIIVRLHNEGNRAIPVKFLELVTSYGGKSIGKGQQIPPRSPRINPKSNALIYQVRATWTEEQNQGSITATVTMVGDAKLTKTIKW